MAFRLQAPETFPADVRFACIDGEERVLHVGFKWLTRDEFVAYCKDGKDKSDPQFFAGLVNSWDGDEPCNEDGLAKLFGYHKNAARALFERYQRELMEVEEKN